MTSTAPEAIRGNRGLHLTVGGTDYSDNVKAFTVAGENADDSDLTFAEAAEGGAQVDTVTGTAIQSTAAASLWRYLWENAGTEVAVVYGPHGNAIPSTDKPHFLMTVKLGVRPSIGGEARRDKTRNDFEFTWDVVDGPTLDTAP